jgi:hypothetical protein
LRAADQLAAPHGEVRCRAAAVGAIVEAELLREAQRVRVHLPAGGAMGGRRRAEDGGVAFAGALHLAARPRGVGGRNAVLPPHVVVAVDARLVPAIAYRLHHVARAPSDVRTGQQRAVEQRAPAVMLDDRGAPHLAQETRAQHAADRAAGVVAAEREEERGVDIVAAEQLDQRRHALARAAQRVDVHLQPETHQSTSALATATSPR